MRFLLVTVVLAWTLIAAHPVPPFIPQAAHVFKVELQREARKAFGAGAPVALFAAQIEAESSWNPRAKSPSGDLGLAQIKTTTARYLARIRPGPGTGSARDPTWSIKAMLWYNYHLREAIPWAANDCERWKMALASYNGGLGNVFKERTLCARAKGCDPGRWSGHVERFGARGKRAYRENRTYIKRVMAFQKKYISWGPMICRVE
jgi:membrane-bound lytic murein transglycosylase MltF